MNIEQNLNTSVRYLKGVGPERSKTLSRLGLETVRDLLYFFPRRYEDRSVIRSVSELDTEDKVCVRGTVQSRGAFRTPSRQLLFKLVLTDGKASLIATWFNQPYLLKVFTPKMPVIFYGKPERHGRHWEMLHPEYEILQKEGESAGVHSGRIVPVYPLTEDLSQKGLRQLAFRVIGEFKERVRDPLPPSVLQKGQLMSLRDAIGQIHFPSGFDRRAEAYRRLVFDEFFKLQLTVQMKRAELQKENKALQHNTGELEVKKLLGSLGFLLTAGQSNSIGEILRDMKKDRPMNRLVQGDVGSGKTAVAAAALMYTVANGFQGALMAPTEVLAQQHFYNLSLVLGPLGVKLVYLGQGLSPAEKKAALTEISTGKLQVVVGTHALIQSGVHFQKLGLAVIDEQHKFGVLQRTQLREKFAGGTHFLLMTATPIPRTLALTLYGDLDISVIGELPKGRQPIRTLWVSSEKRADVYHFLDGELAKGRQAYVICPLVAGAKNFSAKSVFEAHKELQSILAHRKVALLHGRMKSEEKKRIMEDFKDRKIDVLVSTVVIEVGVDVPNAAMMIIENAERFGLSQLHQLRGRIGRGQEESTCILFSDTEEPETAERLSAFEKLQSGFEIAEKDLALRGGGDIAGERQHGMAELKIGDLVQDVKILEEARKAAQVLLEEDPALECSANKLLKAWVAADFSPAQRKMAVVG